MAISQNGYPVITTFKAPIRTWLIPARTGPFALPMVHGSRGFILAHLALWYAENIDDVTNTRDDYGWSPRRIAGTDVWSNHASGTAMDIDSLKHPYGVRNTYSAATKARIFLRLKMYGGAIRWGGTYNTPDDMHWEIDRPLSYCEAVARRLMNTPRGKRILAANPGQKTVILS